MKWKSNIFPISVGKSTEEFAAHSVKTSSLVLGLSRRRKVVLQQLTLTFFSRVCLCERSARANQYGKCSKYQNPIGKSAENAAKQSHASATGGEEQIKWVSEWIFATSNYLARYIATFEVDFEFHWKYTRTKQVRDKKTHKNNEFRWRAKSRDF